MCTVLQQHLSSDYDKDSSQGDSSITRSGTPSTSIFHHQRTSCVSQPTYSYLQDPSGLKRPVDVYDRKISAPAKLAHFHVPVDSGGVRDSGRSRSSYIQHLLGRRARSYSRTGMRAMVEELQTSSRNRSPHMNNEEPISLAQYPDGQKPDGIDKKSVAIERDDFPGPPFVYGDLNRRRRWSEPEKNQDEDEKVVESDDDIKSEVNDQKLERNEAELRKISTGMCQVFLTEIAVEKERRQREKKRLVDPRSSARTPSATHEPYYRLRYASPVNASPSRVAEHPHPWDDSNETSASRSSLAHNPSENPGTFLGRASSLVQPKNKCEYFRMSKSDIIRTEFCRVNHENLLTCFIPDELDDRSDCPSETGKSLPDSEDRNHLLESMGTLSYDVRYPLHLLLTTNFRLPADIDRNNLEKHLTDSEFESVFKMKREEFYRMPYWRRSDLKRKNNLF